MAIRPAFLIKDNKVIREEFNFQWYPGMAVSQKQKSIYALHESIRKKYPNLKIQEISTKALDDLGKKLSAFSLSIKIKEQYYSVEELYQASKVFNLSGNQLDLLMQFTTPREIKKYVRELHKKEEIISFNYFGREFPLDPVSFFYHWLYINILIQNKELAKLIIYSDIFTDIEFNPKKSISSQAESRAIYKWLVEKGVDEKQIKDPSTFLNLVYSNSSVNTKDIENKQMTLFEM